MDDEDYVSSDDSGGGGGSSDQLGYVGNYNPDTGHTDLGMSYNTVNVPGGGAYDPNTGYYIDAKGNVSSLGSGGTGIQNIGSGTFNPATGVMLDSKGNIVSDSPSGGGQGGGGGSGGGQQGKTLAQSIQGMLTGLGLPQGAASTLTNLAPLLPFLAAMTGGNKQPKAPGLPSQYTGTPMNITPPSYSRTANPYYSSGPGGGPSGQGMTMNDWLHGAEQPGGMPQFYNNNMLPATANSAPNQQALWAASQAGIPVSATPGQGGGGGGMTLQDLANISSLATPTGGGPPMMPRPPMMRPMARGGYVSHFDMGGMMNTGLFPPIQQNPTMQPGYTGSPAAGATGAPPQNLGSILGMLGGGMPPAPPTNWTPPQMQTDQYGIKGYANLDGGFFNQQGQQIDPKTGTPWSVERPQGAGAGPGGSNMSGLFGPMAGGGFGFQQPGTPGGNPAGPAGGANGLGNISPMPPPGGGVAPPAMPMQGGVGGGTLPTMPTPPGGFNAVQPRIGTPGNLSMYQQLMQQMQGRNTGVAPPTMPTARTGPMMRPQMPPMRPQPMPMRPGMGGNMMYRARGGYTGNGYGSGIDHAGPGYARGPGDGTSDDINAKLSDGEYVIDAPTVSLLGNGSNEAGAKRLDAMRVNVRKHAGKKLARGKQPMSARAPEQYLSAGYQ